MRSPPTPLFSAMPIAAARFSRPTSTASSALEPPSYRLAWSQGSKPAIAPLAMLAWWGIDAAEHQPTKLDRRLCDQASAIFVMSPPYLRRLLLDYDADLASKAYLYADPFSLVSPSRLAVANTRCEIHLLTNDRRSSWSRSSPGCATGDGRSAGRCLAGADR
jgi:hypothetical protein